MQAVASVAATRLFSCEW